MFVGHAFLFTYIDKYNDASFVKLHLFYGKFYLHVIYTIIKLNCQYVFISKKGSYQVKELFGNYSVYLICKKNKKISTHLLTVLTINVIVEIEQNKQNDFSNDFEIFVLIMVKMKKKQTGSHIGGTLYEY